jgi:endoribonuclease LACTB2
VNQKTATPKDAAAVILLNHNLTEVLWAQRNPKLSFLGGWHAFLGGKVEPSDSEIRVRNCADKDLEKFIVAATRECFEETGVMLTRGGDKLTKGQRTSLHDDLVSGRSDFSEILADWNLWIDAEDFFYTGFWTTPQFSPVRFKTRFFIAVCPPKQTPSAAISELQSVEFIEPKDAVKLWANSKVLISPPVLISLKELEKYKAENLHNLSKALLSKSQTCDGEINYIELTPHLICFPLRTDTLPPATHTNCFIIGDQGFIVIDPASSYENEQNLLHEYIDSRVKKGDICHKIFLTHEHKDHIGGVVSLQNHLHKNFGIEVPVVAHVLTAKRLPAEIKVDEFIEDTQQMKFSTLDYDIQGVRVLHTPGHARGHLCFYFEKRGFLLSGDNVVGAGTVLIAPPEGNMTDYLDSLERMKNLPNLRFLCGSHGAAVFDAKSKIEEYIAHRLERERQILEAVESGAKTSGAIVEKVYVGLKPELTKLAEKSVEAHLEKLKAEGRI